MPRAKGKKAEEEQKLRLQEAAEAAYGCMACGPEEGVLRVLIH